MCLVPDVRFMEEKALLSQLVEAELKPEHRIIYAYHIDTKATGIEESVVQWIVITIAPVVNISGIPIDFGIKTEGNYRMGPGP